MQESIQLLTSQLRQQHVNSFNVLFKGMVIGDTNCTMDIYKSGFGDLAFFDNATLLTTPEAAMIKIGNFECSDDYLKLQWTEPHLHLTARELDCLHSLEDIMAAKPEVRVWPLGIYLIVCDITDQQVNIRQIWWCMYGKAVSIPIDILTAAIADRKKCKNQIETSEYNKQS